MADKDSVTVIGPDAHIKGEMTFPSSARLLGSIEGSIKAQSELHVADGATCNASIDAAKITVDGKVRGNVVASERVELSAGAHVEGDIDAARLVVVEGASFVGHCRIGAETNGAVATSPAAAHTETTTATTNGNGNGVHADEDEDEEAPQVKTRSVRSRSASKK